MRARTHALVVVLALAGCGGEVSSGSPEDPTADGIRSEESAPLEWWNVYKTSVSMDYGWWDTDLGVSSSTPVQLRHASTLYKFGVYGWGYMPEFVDTVTGDKFRFLHLRPQHMYATEVGHTYPAGYIVGVSGGDTHDTGYPTYSTGPHLCVQTIVTFGQAFPPGGGGASSGGGSGSASCHSSTLNRVVGAGTCVQSASDSNWYTCENGAWVAGQHNCGASYPFCHSATLGRYVPARTCVQSRYDRVWYQCNHDGWDTPVANGAGPVGSCSAEFAL
jgi:hypothetical protein